MDNDQKGSKNEAKLAPDTSNDQLGENADMEFAQEYDNKSGAKTAGNAKKNQ